MRVSNRSPFRHDVKGSYRIENKKDEAHVYLYDEISDWFGISAEQFVKDLAEITSKTIHLHVNSPGGSVFDGTAIYNALKQHSAKIISHVDGLAASIASVIIMAGDEVRMGDNAFLMIHEPWSIVLGSAEDLRKEADLLDKVSGTIAKTYMDKTGKDESEIKDLMSEETWFTAEEALEAGFIDFIDKDKPSEKNKSRTVLFDLSAFANVPDALKERKAPPTARELERALRDAGLSAKEAKTILSSGLKEEDQRDVDPQDSDPPPPGNQRDVDPPEVKKDRVADLLIRAEVMAPSLTID